MTDKALRRTKKWLRMKKWREVGGIIEGLGCLSLNFLLSPVMI
jgi:hypothetical protein